MKVREATIDDFPCIKRVLDRNGVRYPGYAPGLSDIELHQRYTEVWSLHPSANSYRDVPIGWVLESDDGEVVGSLSNQYMPYVINGHVYRSAAASSWAVDPDYRSGSLTLITRFLNQSNLDLVINSSATIEAAKVLKAFKCKPVPSPEFDTALFWVLNHGKVIDALLWSKGFPEYLGIGVLVKPFAQLAERLISRNRLPKQKLEVTTKESFGEEFDVFWGKLSDSGKLLALRSSAVLKLRFGLDVKEGRVKILTIEQGGDLKAYALLQSVEQTRYKLNRWRIIDIQSLDKDEELIKSLIAAIGKLCKTEKVDVVELIGLNVFVRNVLLSTNPYIRKLTHCPFLYKAISKEFKALEKEGYCWEASQFDGDSS